MGRLPLKDKWPDGWWHDVPHADLGQHLRTIRDNIIEIIMPPAAMGSGHRGVAHKCGLMSYGWALGNSSLNLRRIGQSFVSQTSDMGVEMSIPDFACRDPSELLTSFMARV